MAPDSDLLSSPGAVDREDERKPKRWWYACKEETQLSVREKNYKRATAWNVVGRGRDL
jgi:hypothetical protein